MSFSLHTKKALSTSNSGMATPVLTNSPYQKSQKKIVLKKCEHIKTISMKSLHKSTLSSTLGTVLKDTTSSKFEKKKLFDYNDKSMKKLEDKLKLAEAIQKDKSISFEVFEIFRELFEDIISLDCFFGSYLLKVKQAYENWIKSKIGYVAENTQLKSELDNLYKTIKELTDVNEMLLKKLKKLSKENEKQFKELEMVNTQYRSLQEHLIKIHNVTDEEFPQSGDAWKVIIAENKKFIDICEGLKGDVEQLKKNEKTLMMVIDYAKLKGFPIDKAYKHVAALKQRGKKHSDIDIDQNIIFSPAKISFKPSCVPNLKIHKGKKKNFSIPASLSNSKD